MFIECCQLRNMDIIGRSDPFALLFLDSTGPTHFPTNVPFAQPSQEATDDAPPLRSHPNSGMPAPRRTTLGRGRYHGRDARWERIGRTETVGNSLACRFVTSFEIPYFFERSQKLAVDLFDRDTASLRDEDMHRHDYLGSVEFSVPALARAPGQRLQKPLKIADRPDQNFGYCTVIVEEVSMSKQRINYNLSLAGLKAPWLGKRGRGPFLTISRQSAGGAEAGSGDWISVFRTKFPAHLAPQGRNTFDLGKLTYNYEKFCRCDDNLILRFDISYERRAKHNIVATAFSSLADIEAAGGVLQLQNGRPTEAISRPRPPPSVSARIKSTGGTRSAKSIGKLMLQNRSIVEETTFLDYVIGGCEISLMVGIDFTASNGDPMQPGTLHYWDALEPNEYELAIRSAGDILAEYDTDQLIPAFGFGAKLPPDYNTPCHKFPLKEGPDNNCRGIDEVLHAYRHVLFNARLAGPTVFAEVVREAATHAAAGASRNEQSYTILLLVTDGVINDVDNTLREIARASAQPLSIVIIGVGGADFSDMVYLDGDDENRERDIVQFVSYRQYCDQPEVLQSKVLEEIPRQFLEYFRWKGIKPNPVRADLVR